MLPVLEQLLVIQDRDRRIVQLQAEQSRIPREIEATETQVKEQTARVESFRDQLKHLEADRKRVELEVDSKNEQVDRYNAQLFQIKSNTEYQALLKEIAECKKGIEALEDDELEVMEKAQQLEADLRREEESLNEATGRAGGEKEDLKKRIILIEQELEQLRAERSQLAQETETDALNRYDRLMRSKGDIAVAPIREDGCCGGCHLRLAPQVIHTAKGGAEVPVCDYCGRILYWQGD